MLAMPMLPRLLVSALFTLPLAAKADPVAETVTVTGDRVHLIETRPDDTAPRTAARGTLSAEILRRLSSGPMTRPPSARWVPGISPLAPMRRDLASQLA